MSNVTSRSTKCSGSDVMCPDDAGGPARLVPVVDAASAPASMAAPRPTPSVSSAEFSFDVFESGAGADFELAVFDLSGRRLRTIQRGVATPGSHRASWNLVMENGQPAAPGTYFARLRVGAWQQTVALHVLR